MSLRRIQMAVLVRGTRTGVGPTSLSLWRSRALPGPLLKIVAEGHFGDLTLSWRCMWSKLLSNWSWCYRWHLVTPLRPVSSFGSPETGMCILRVWSRSGHFVLTYSRKDLPKHGWVSLQAKTWFPPAWLPDPTAWFDVLPSGVSGGQLGGQLSFVNHSRPMRGIPLRVDGCKKSGMGSSLCSWLLITKYPKLHPWSAGVLWARLLLPVASFFPQKRLCCQERTWPILGDLGLYVWDIYAYINLSKSINLYVLTVGWCSCNLVVLCNWYAFWCNNSDLCHQLYLSVEVLTSRKSGCGERQGFTGTSLIAPWCLAM